MSVLYLFGEQNNHTDERQILLGICAMEKKSCSKPMQEILERLDRFEHITIVVFEERVRQKKEIFYNSINLLVSNLIFQFLQSTLTKDYKSCMLHVFAISLVKRTRRQPKS